MPATRSTPTERFWRRVSRENDLESVLETPCWKWTGAITKKGYGNMGLIGERWMYAHQFSYELHFGRVRAGRQVNHRCNNRACVNPGHLYEGTQADNMRDRVRAGRMVGESHANAKLTAAKVRRIRRDRRSYGIIANEHGVCRATVCLVKRRKIWRHVQ